MIRRDSYSAYYGGQDLYAIAHPTEDRHMTADEVLAALNARSGPSGSTLNEMNSARNAEIDAKDAERFRWLMSEAKRGRPVLGFLHNPELIDAEKRLSATLGSKT